SSQDGPRVRRLRQGQSGQDQHGIVRQRVRVPCLRRTVQDHDRHQPSPRSVSRRLRFPSAQRTGAGRFWHHIFENSFNQGRPAARAGGDNCDRSDVLPDIPTLAEFVPGYEASQWYGVGAPKDTPAEVIDKLNMEINAVVADPLIKARLAGVGVDPMSMTSAAFGKFIAEETEKWGNVIRALNIKVE